MGWLLGGGVDISDGGIRGSVGVLLVEGVLLLASAVASGALAVTSGGACAMAARATLSGG